MSWLDLIIVGLAVLAAVGGYRLGFLARASSWIGLGLGLYVAARILPPVCRRWILAARSPAGCGRGRPDGRRRRWVRGWGSSSGNGSGGGWSDRFQAYPTRRSRPESWPSWAMIT